MPEVAKFLRNFSAASALNLEVEHAQEGPSALLRPGNQDGQVVPVWTGSLTAEMLNQISDSIAAKELVNKLLHGDSVVWVVVTGEDQRKNDQVVTALEKRLRYLQQVIQIPEADPRDPSSKPGPGPILKLQFSVMQIPGVMIKNRGASHSESLLVRMLAGSKSELTESSQPWIAAVFGRGRVLGAWPSAAFEDEQVEEVALFLAGACSCQVKRQNPGWDLLLHVDWEEELHNIAQKTIAEQASIVTLNTQHAETETVRFEPVPRKNEGVTAGSGKLRLLLPSALLLLVLIVASRFLVGRRGL